MLNRLLERRVPQYLGLYLGTGWVVLEFSDWVVGRYLLGPGWTDLILALWLIMLPSVALIAYGHGRPGADEWTRLEKVAISCNVFAALAALIVVASGRDLGVIARTVTVTDETGTTIERLIPRSEYRRKLAMLLFDNNTGDAAYEWLSVGLPFLLEFDLYQDEFLQISDVQLFMERLRESGFGTAVGVPLPLQLQLAERSYLDYLITGELIKRDGLPVARISIYELAGARLKARHDVPLTDPFDAADQLSVLIKRGLELPDQHLDRVADLPVSEIVTGSEQAYRAASAGLKAMIIDQDWQQAGENLKQAVATDPTFSAAYFYLYAVSLLGNDAEAVKASLQSTVDHVYRLPERLQLAAKTEYYVLGQDFQRAMTVANMHTEFYPEDVDARLRVAQLHVLRGDQAGAVAAMEVALEIDPTQYNLLPQIGHLYEELDQAERAREYFQRYSKAQPRDPQALITLGEFLARQGELQAAEQRFLAATAIAPENITAAVSLGQVYLQAGRFDNALVQLEAALAASQTPAQKAQCHRGLFDYHLLRGQLADAMAQRQRYLDALEQSQPPVMVIMARLSSLGVYVQAGQAETARAVIADAGDLPPPYENYPAIGALNIALEERDLTNLRAALPAADEFVSQTGLEVARPIIVYGEATALELEGNLETALVRFDEAIRLDPTRLEWRRDAARVLRKLGRLKEAQARIERALAIRSTDPRLNVEAAEIALAMEKPDAANSYLTAALDAWAVADSVFQPAQRAARLLAELKSRF